MRVRLCFSKTGPLRFIGHLDFLRAFQRTIRRASLPVAYSQGFNPHMLLSFALPVPVGIESINDYADLILEDEVDLEMVAEKLSSMAPKGLAVSRVYRVHGKAAAQTVAADYLLKAPSPVSREAVQMLLDAPSIIIPKKTKKGIKNTDIRKDIFFLKDPCLSNTFKESAWQVLMRLAAGSAGFLNPIPVAKLLLGEAPCPTSITRLELFQANEEGRFITL